MQKYSVVLSSCFHFIAISECTKIPIRRGCCPAQPQSRQTPSGPLLFGGVGGPRKDEKNSYCTTVADIPLMIPAFITGKRYRRPVILDLCRAFLQVHILNSQLLSIECYVNSYLIHADYGNSLDLFEALSILDNTCSLSGCNSTGIVVI